MQGSNQPSSSCLFENQKAPPPQRVQYVISTYRAAEPGSAHCGSRPLVRIRVNVVRNIEGGGMVVC